MAVMLRGLVMLIGLAAAAGAQQAEVAGGYHVVHPERTTATDTPTASAGKTVTKKPMAKKKHLKKT
jgi:hypothetical protein